MTTNLSARRIGSRLMLVPVLAVWFLLDGSALGQDANGASGASPESPAATSQPVSPVRRYSSMNEALKARRLATRPASPYRHDPGTINPSDPHNNGVPAPLDIKMSSEARHIDAVDDAQLEALKAAAKASTRPGGPPNQPAMPVRVSPRKPPAPGEATPGTDSTPPVAEPVMVDEPQPAVDAMPPTIEGQDVPVDEPITVENGEVPAPSGEPASSPAATPGAVGPHTVPPRPSPGAPTTHPAHTTPPTHGRRPGPVPGARPGEVHAPQPAGPTPQPATTDPNSGTAVPKLDPKTYWKLPYNERPYFFNWNNTPLEKCCADFVEMSGLSMVGLLGDGVSEPDRKKTITFQSLELQTFDQALTRFNLITQEVGMGYWTMVRDGYLEFRQLSEWYRRMPAERLYDSQEAYEKANLPEWEMASMMYTPKHQPAVRLAQWVNDSVPDNCARATLFPDSSWIEIRGCVYHINRALEILAKRDIEIKDGREWRTYPLKHRTPAEASSQLQGMMLPEGLMGGASGIVPSPTPTPTPAGPPGRPPRGVPPRAPAGPVEVGTNTGDDIEILEPLSGSTLLVLASPAKHKRIEELLAQYIDVEGSDPRQRRIFDLKYSDPNEMIELLNSFLGEQKMIQPPAPPAKPGQPPTPPPPPQIMRVNSSATMKPRPPRSILVEANEKEMKKIEELIALLDVEIEESKYQVVKLEHADASSVAMVLTSIITGRASSQSRYPRPGMPPSGIGAEGFKAIPDNTTDRTLVLSGSQQDIAEARKLIAELDIDPAAGAAEHIVQLKNAEPGSVVQILTTRFGGSSSGGGYRRSPYGYGGYGGGASQSLPQFVPDDESKMLVVICHDAMWPDINKLIVELDEKSETLKTTRSYQIKHANAESVSMLLSQALGSGGGSSYYRRYGMGGGGEGRQPSFLVNTSTNLLLVTAIEEDHVKAAELIEKLDQPSPADQAEFRPIDLEQADAEYVAEKIEEVLGGEGGSSRRRSYRSYDYSYGGSYGSGSEGAPKVPVRVIAETMGNRVLVSASDEDFKKAEALAREIDAQYIKQEIVRKTFILENTDAWEVQQIISSMFDAQSSGGGRSSRYGGYSSYGGGYSSSGLGSSSAPGSVKIAPMGNGLVVQAPKDKMAEIEKFIAEIDKNPTAGNEVKMYKVKSSGYEGSAGVARTLCTLLGIPDTSSRWGPSSNTKSPIKIMGDYGSNVLFVSAPKDKMPEIDKQIQEYLATQGGDTTMILKHFEVTKARPQEVADMVQPILDTKYREIQESSGSRSRYGGWYGGPSSGGPQITVNKITRKLMVMAPAELMTTAEELIREFDQPSQASVTRTVTLKTARAEEIAPIVQEQMKATPGSTGSSRGASRFRFPWDYYNPYGSSRSSSDGDEDLVVTAFEAGNSIILRGTEEKVFEAEQFIKMLDAGSRPDGPMIKVFQLQFADPYTVSDYIDEVTGGGESTSLTSTTARRLSTSSAAVSVKTDYATKRLIVAAPPEKFPLIEQVIEIQERLAGELAARPTPDGDDPIINDDGTIKKFYTVEGPAKEIAKRLDEILYGMYGYKGPWVKYFPYTNQVVIDGDPKYFKAAEEWLAKLEKNPPPVALKVLVRRSTVAPSKVLPHLQRMVPTSLNKGAGIRRLESGGVGRDPMSMIEEVKYDTPIGEPKPDTRPAKAQPLTGQPQVEAVSHFVPTGVLSRIEQELASIPLAQVTVVSKPAATAKPAAPAAATRPANAPNVAPPPNQAEDLEDEVSEEQMTAEQRQMAALYEAAAEARASNQPQILYDEVQGTFIIIGSEDEVEEIDDILTMIIKELDEIEEGAKGDIRVFRVNHIDVQIAAMWLETLFNEGAKGQQAAKAQARKPQPPAKPGEKKAKPGEEEEEDSAAQRRREEEEQAKAKEAEEAAAAAAATSIKVVPDPRTSTLIIRAAQETFPKIIEVLLKIDRPGPDKVQNIRIFQLKKLNAAEVEEVLKEILKIETPRQQRTFRPRMPGRGSGGAEVDMIEALEQQMLEFQQSMIESSTAGAGGEGKNGKTKINPAKEISIASNATTNTIIVTAPEEGMKLVETLINRLEEQDIPIAIKTVELEHAEAEKVATQLQGVFETTQRRGGTGGMRGGMDGYTPSRMGDFKVAADSRTNRLVIRALETDMERIMTIVEELDSIPSNPVEIYAVEKASAEDMAKTLTEIYGTQGAGVGGAQTVRITADRNTNSVLVRAPKAQQLLIAAKIKDLEQQSVIRGTVREIQLKVATPTVVAKQLENIFASTSRSRGARQEINIEGDDASKMLFVICPQDMYEEIKKIAEQMDQTTEQTVKIFPLDHASAAEVLARLKELAAQIIPKLGGSVGADSVFAVSADERTNAIIAAGTPKALVAVEAVVTQLDQPPSDKTLPVTKMFPLNRGNAASVAATINQLYGSKRWQAGVEAPKAAPDPVANVVFVTGTASQLELIDEQVIKPLEGYSQVKPLEVAVNDYEVTVTYADVEVLASQLTTMFAQGIQARKAAGDTSLTPLETAMSIVPEPSTRKLFISCSAENKEKKIDKWLKGLDVEVASTEGQQIKVLPVRFADLGFTVQALTGAFVKTGKVPASEQVKIMPEYGTSSIVVRARKKDMDEIEKVLADVDREDRDRKTYTVDLKNADPEDVAQSLTTIYNSGPRSRASRTPAVFTPVPGARRLLVTCTPTEIEQAKGMIEQLDVSPEESGVKRAMRVVPVKKLPAREMMQMLTEYLRKPGKSGSRDPSLQDDIKVTASDTADAVVLSGPEERLDELQQLIEKVDGSVVDPSDPNAGGRQYAVIPLTNADPSSVAQVISQTYQARGNVPDSEKVNAVAERATNSVVVSASAEKLEIIRKMIDELDQQSTNVPQQEIIRLKNARAEDILEVLRQTYQMGRRGMSSSGPPITFAADSNGNSLVVSAGKADMEGIKLMVGELDKPVTDEVDQLRIIPLQFVDAQETLQILNEYLRKPGAAAGRRGSTSELIGDIRLQASATLNALIASGSQDELDRVQKIALDMDKQVEGAGAPKIIPIKHGTAATLAATLTSLFTDPAKQKASGRTNPENVPLIMYDDGANSLIVRARPMDYTLIEDMVKQLDKPGEGLGGLEVIPVSRGVDVVALARQIQDVINAGERAKRSSQSTYKPREVAIAGEERSSTLIVSGSPEMFETVKKLAADLEQKRPETGGRRALVVPVKTKSAQDIQKVIEAYIEQQNGRTQRRR